MPTARIQLVVPTDLTEFVQGQSVSSALHAMAQLAGAQLTIVDAADAPADTADITDMPICYRGQAHGRVSYSAAGEDSHISDAATSVHALLEHLLEREMAVSDLARAMVANYEELNVLYKVLPRSRPRWTSARSDSFWWTKPRRR